MDFRKDGHRLNYTGSEKTDTHESETTLPPGRDKAFCRVFPVIAQPLKENKIENNQNPRASKKGSDGPTVWTLDAKLKAASHWSGWGVREVMLTKTLVLSTLNYYREEGAFKACLFAMVI